MDVVDLRSIFLPKDKEAALRDIAERLYRLHAEVEANNLDWVAFKIENILDIIERS